MNNKNVYEYAVIRIVPNIERQEFLNAGLILFSKTLKILLCKTLLKEEKLKCFGDKTDVELIRNNLHSFEMIALGQECGSPISSYDLASRFRWLTASKSTAIQCSPVHPGLAEEVTSVFEKLFAKLVQ